MDYSKAQMVSIDESVARPTGSRVVTVTTKEDYSFWIVELIDILRVAS